MTGREPPEHRGRRSSVRAGHLAGGLLILVGLAGLGRAAQATAAPPPSAPSAVAAPAVSTTASRGGIVVTNAYLVAKGPAEATAYLTVSNQGSAPDYLTAITADEIAHEATLYLSGGETTTSPLRIGPGATDTLRPGGRHVELALHGPLTPHQAVTLSLTFSRAGDVNVLAFVR